MSELSTFDLKSFVTSAVNEVFDTMISMEVEIFDADSEVTVDGRQIQGSIDFTGEVTGSIVVLVSDDFARLMAASMQGIDVEENESGEELEDVIRELSSIIGGSLKTGFNGLGISCELSVPTITTGSDIPFEALDMERNERLAFRHQQHTAIVDVSVKMTESTQTPSQTESDTGDTIEEEAAGAGDESEGPDDGVEEEVPAAAEEAETLDDVAEEVLPDAEYESEGPEERVEEEVPAAAEEAETLDDAVEEVLPDAEDGPEGSEERVQEETPVISEAPETLDHLAEKALPDAEDESEGPDESVEEALEEPGESEHLDLADAFEEEAPEAEDRSKTPDNVAEEGSSKAEDEPEGANDAEGEDVKIGAPPEGEVRAHTAFSPKKDKKTGLFLKIIPASVFVIVCLLGLVLYEKRPKTPVQAQSFPVQKTKRPNPTPFNLIDDRLHRVSDLRNELLAKQKDITDLKEHYKNGIGEMKREIFKEIRKKGAVSYQQALENERIELALRTIQRRRAYVQQLDQVSDRLYRGSEELLYLERQTKIDMQMAGFTSGIEMVELVKRIDGGIQKHLLSTDNLSMGSKGGEPQNLEAIWKGISAGKKEPQGEIVQISQEDEENREIWQEVCEGNFSRKYELTELCLEATKCLSQWKGKELNLSGLIELSAEVAKSLSQWRGNWLSLNGLTHLSPEVARSLSQWRGNWLSLNGLTHLSPEVARSLSQWRGEQLELIGLKRLAETQGKQLEREGLKYLAIWERSGGRLFLPDKVRRQIEEIMQ